LINAVLVTVYTSIAKRKLEGYTEGNESIKRRISKWEAEKNECNGKISVLREVKTRITKSVVYSESIIEKGIKSVKKALTKEEEVTADPDFDEMKEKIIEDSNTIVENLKNIENEQENDFQEYLKSLGRVLISQKALINK